MPKRRRKMCYRLITKNARALPYATSKHDGGPESFRLLRRVDRHTAVLRPEHHGEGLHHRGAS